MADEIKPTDPIEPSPAAGTFNVPTDAYPKSESFSASSNLGTSSSASQASNWAGIDWSSPIAGGLQGTMLEQAQALPGYAAGMQGAITDQYSTMMRQGYYPALQAAMNQLAAKGMLSSSVAGDVLTQTQGNINKDIQDKAYQALVAGEQAKMGVPGTLSGIIGQLGSVSTGTSSSVSESATAGTSLSGSLYENPLAPYELMASMLNSDFFA